MLVYRLHLHHRMYKITPPHPQMQFLSGWDHKNEKTDSLHHHQWTRSSECLWIRGATDHSKVRGGPSDVDIVSITSSAVAKALYRVRIPFFVGKQDKLARPESYSATEEYPRAK